MGEGCGLSRRLSVQCHQRLGKAIVDRATLDRLNEARLKSLDKQIDALATKLNIRPAATDREGWDKWNRLASKVRKLRMMRNQQSLPFE